jgi:hypothetical protein
VLRLVVDSLTSLVAFFFVSFAIYFLVSSAFSVYCARVARHWRCRWRRLSFASVSSGCRATLCTAVARAVRCVRHERCRSPRAALTPADFAFALARRPARRATRLPHVTLPSSQRLCRRLCRGIRRRRRSAAHGRTTARCNENARARSRFVQQNIFAEAAIGAR